jgi:hypothetical protein
MTAHDDKRQDDQFRRARHWPSLAPIGLSLDPPDRSGNLEPLVDQLLQWHDEENGGDPPNPG